MLAQLFLTLFALDIKAGVGKNLPEVIRHNVLICVGEVEGDVALASSGVCVEIQLPCLRHCLLEGLESLLEARQLQVELCPSDDERFFANLVAPSVSACVA